MELPQVNDALRRLFREQGKRIVFWNDAKRITHDLKGVQVSYGKFGDLLADVKSMAGGMEE